MDFISFIGKMVAQDCVVSFRESPHDRRAIEIKLSYFGGVESVNMVQRLRREELSDPQILSWCLGKIEHEFMDYLEKNVKRPMPLPA